MNVYTLSEREIDAELVARQSRTSGTIESRRQRLQRFLEFENQKERRNTFVREQKEAELECYDGCPCNNNNEEETVAAADALLNLRQQTWVENNIRDLLQSFADLDESYEVVVGENLRLNQRIDNLEMRLSHLENRSESPPSLIFPESNPNWRLDTAMLN